MNIEIKSALRDEIVSEGIATTVYFVAKNELTTGYLTVILDIGGGSTELVFVKNRNIEFHDSIKFAGDNFILAAPTLYKKIVDIKDLNSVDIDKNFLKRFNLKFSSGDYLLPGWNNKLAAFLDEKEFKEEVNFLNAFFYGSILFYIGLHLARINFNETNLNIAFAGNGARFLEIITYGNPLSSRTLGDRWLNFFKSMVNAGLSLSAEIEWPRLENVSFFFSNHPKSEVVLGLLYDNLIKEYREKESQLKKMLGLDIELNNTKYSWFNWPTIDNNANRFISANIDYSIFYKFLSEFWANAKQFLNINNEKDIDIENVKNKFKNSLERRGSLELAAPLFFECVNAYMQEYTK